MFFFPQSLISWFSFIAKHKASVNQQCFSSPLQYASVKKNDEYFMSPEDFVDRFVHAHTDLRLSDDGTALLAGVVDQKKDG